MTTILAPIDLSAISGEVVAHAARLARALHGRVILMTVMLEPVFVKEYAPLPENSRRVMVGNESATQRRLAALERQLARESVASKSVILRGGPARLILEQARKSKADYIVMGSHGHTAFFELIAGSTTQGVLNRARCPVVIIPAPIERARSR